MAVLMPTMMAYSPSHALDSLSDSNMARQMQQSFVLEEAIERVVSKSFQCPICQEFGILDDCVELDCGDRICKECFMEMLQHKIDQKHVDQHQLQCPLCRNAEITDMQVYGALKDVAPELWTRFLDTRLEHWQPSQGEGEVRCDCPKCSTAFTFPTRRLSLARSWRRIGEEVSCPTCEVRFCPLCSTSHPGLTCEESRQKELKENPAEEQFEEYLRQVGGKRCPVCSSACIRESGCNFMTCPSKRCRNRTKFCYICGVELRSHAQHLVHFPHGPYHDVCFGSSGMGQDPGQAEKGPVQGFFQDTFRALDSFFQNGS